MIPVPMMGFKSLNQRLQLQNQMTEGHQNRNDIIQKEIRKLQVGHNIKLESVRRTYFYRTSKQQRDRKLRKENEEF